MKIKRVCVYCASSRKCAATYHATARRLGGLLARAGITLVYGGGAVGSMGALADGALAAGGRVVGVIPQFLDELERAHHGLSDLILVRGMHERKRQMIAEVDGIAALPGGCGTFEELFEAIAWKRLGLYNGPIVIVNSNGYYNPCLEMLDRAVKEHFMDERHRAIWSVVAEPDQVLDAMRDAPPWSSTNRNFAIP